VLRVDRDWDLAALAIRRPNVQPIPLATQAPQFDEALTIIGYGGGSYRAFNRALHPVRFAGNNLPQEMVELSTSAREGDSGGPILNSRGELAGVLFGTAFGRTTGSYCGRVRVFLTTVEGDFRTLSNRVMLADRARKTGVPETELAAVGGDRGRSKRDSGSLAGGNSRWPAGRQRTAGLCGSSTACAAAASIAAAHAVGGRILQCSELAASGEDLCGRRPNVLHFWPAHRKHSARRPHLHGRADQDDSRPDRRRRRASITSCDCSARLWADHALAWLLAKLKEHFGKSGQCCIAS